MINITTISNALCSTVPLHCLCWEPRENSEPLPSVVLRNDSRKPRFELKFSPASFLLFVSVTFVLSVPHKSSAQLGGKSYNRWHVVFIPQRQRPGLMIWSYDLKIIHRHWGEELFSHMSNQWRASDRKSHFILSKPSWKDDHPRTRPFCLENQDIPN